MLGAIDERDHGFGIRDLPIGSYHPPSALQGPFKELLQYHPARRWRSF